MNVSAGRRYCLLWGLVGLALADLPASAELAKVHLKNGTVLRGDVELTESEVLVRNLAGVVRCERERVDHIEWLEPAKNVEDEHVRRLYALAPRDVEGHLTLASWLARQEALELAREQCNRVLSLEPENEGATLLLREIETALAARQKGEPVAEDAPGEGEASRRRFKGVPPPPPLSPGDMLRLKLSEIALDGPPERLNVRFLKVRGQPDLEELVREEMADALDYDPDWEDTLGRSKAYEKLPIVLRATGLKYVDRIELRGNPRAFTTYRQRVLPQVARGCVRSGCHGGHTAHAFRFPTGLQSSDEFVYTSFAMLDVMETATGPMINRGLPEDSALLHYLLPAQAERPTHPPVEDRRVMPVLRGTRDPRYQAIVDWIGSLRSPHPDYQLEYEFPPWFERLSQPAGEPLVFDEFLPEASAESQPAAPHPDDVRERRDGDSDESP